MSLFLSDEELRLLSDDAATVAERADGAIRDLRCQLDTVRAEADAAAIAAEQNCALLEQRYETLSSDLARVRSENTHLSASLEQRLSEIADAQAEKYQLHLKAIAKDGEIERLSLEAAEHNKSKRHFLELLEQKDAETREKNATIQSYLDKIINLTDNAVDKEAKLQNQESELARCHATCVRVNQEKELLEKHNAWLNEELSAKFNSLVEERKTHMEIVADMSAKLADFERQINESSSSLKRNNERIQELEMRNASLEKELCSSKDTAAANEEQLSSELSTVTKLAELYKERSEEWSKKAGELEGVIKALETHLSQVENEYKNKLENESSLRKNLEKDASDMKGKLEKYEAELESARKANELSIIPMSRFHADTNLEELSVAETTSCRTYENNQMLVPKIPIGISGTALAASLIRDGWSLAKMYEKYQEAADAVRHEKWGRKNAEAVLERVLHEIEEKAEIILDERAEHERMIEAYNLMNQKLQQSLLEHDSFENTIRNLKAELKKRERDYTIAQKEISDLEKQVTVLLKECQDIQVRCGVSQVYADNSLASSLDINGINAGGLTTECPMSFKDINELVEQNVQLRSHVLRLSSEIENKEEELKENFQIQLQKVTEEATAKVDAVLKKSEEQGQMIESLHSSVAMYRRLYEEERRMLASSHVSKESIPEDGKKELMLLFEGSQEVSRKAYEQLAERARSLEEDLGKLRSEVSSLRLERDKRALEATFARDHFDGLKKEIEHQRKEANAVSARNVELTQLVVDFQKRLRECSNSLQEAEENARKLSMEVSILKHEKEILNNSERRASDEVRNLSERVHRLQSSLDTIQSAGEVRENSRAAEMRKLEEYTKRVEREWAEAKRELQEERDRVRALTNEKENALEASINQFQEMKKELAEAWSAVASAESRAAVAEARCSEFETKMKSTEHKTFSMGFLFPYEAKSCFLYPLLFSLVLCLRWRQTMSMTVDDKLKNLVVSFPLQSGQGTPSPAIFSNKAIKSAEIGFDYLYGMNHHGKQCMKHQAFGVLWVVEADNDPVVSGVAKQLKQYFYCGQHVGSNQSPVCGMWFSSLQNTNNSCSTCNELAPNHVIKGDSRHDRTVFSTNEVSGELWKITEELEKIKEEAKANKDYMVQYKEIAHTNEVALKQIESAHETYKLEAERVKKALEGEVSSLRDRVSELEKQYVLKCEEAVSLTEAKDREVSSLLAETSGLRGEISQKVTQIESLGTQLSSLKEDLEREHKRWRTAQDNYERQVMLQSETIQELTKTSKELSLLQCEIAKLQEVSDTVKTENEMLKTSWEKEKVTLQAMKDEAERKSNELNEQNKILLGQLESLHVRLADKEHNSAGLFAQSTDSKAESDLHSVISHLRRSKEIAETEKTLLKQENSRLQLQLETALKASEAAQKLLHSKCENDRAMLFKDEEFKALQLQVREINLLRESNMQLREENKHNFDECQKYRDEAQKAKVDAEKYENLLMEKQLEFDACQKEVEMLRIEINHLNNRINELAESHKNVDPEEYERMKNELQQTKALLRDSEAEVGLANNLVTEKQGNISNLEQALAKCKLELTEKEKKLNDAVQVEGTIKQENEKQKKVFSILKKKNDALAKEKEDLNQEKEVLLKEIEDFKSGRKTSGDTSIDQATKEKDTRIQILEKTLERERDDNKKEKQKRQSTEKTMLELIQKVNKDKKSFLEEFSRHKHAVETLKATGVTASQLPSESTLDEQFATYLQTTTQLEAASGSIADDGLGSHSVAVDTSATDTSMPVAGSGRQVSAQQIRQLTSQVKSAEEKERGSTMVKVATGARKVGRRLVRPRLERPEEPQVDVGTSGMDGPTQMEEEKAGSSHEPEPAGDNSLAQSTSSSRKRLASSTAEQKEDIVARDEVGADTAPPPKKPKESDVMQDVIQDSNDEQTILPATENIETAEAAFPSSNISDVQTPEDMEADQAPVLPNEETADAAEDDDTFVKEEPVEEQKASFDDTNHEEEVQGEGDAIVEELSDKPTETIELLDESLRSEGGKEMLQQAAADEDEKEEGELIADEAEEQEEGGKSGDCQRESTPSDGAGIGDETGYAVEASSPEVPNEKNASADAMDEVREGNNNEDQFVHESSQSPQRSLGVREGSLSTTGHATISQQQSSSTISETEESRAGRTITISERAKQNARLRQAGIAAPTTSRGRGRTTGGFRGNRGAGRGGRARGGRGQAFGERE
ncbi:Permease family [Musa troglodytarum]|nr:Permease family [Musa troglodytarum]